jgi:hypothetical protein
MTAFAHRAPYSGTTDGNRRIVLRTLLVDDNKPFNFFVSHFTYATGAGQMSNAFGTCV